MAEPIELHFESNLHASREQVWDWITSVRCIRKEMWPYFYMTAPHGLGSLDEIRVKPGQRMFRSYVFLFGFLPIDYSDMTLLEIEAGQGFVEQSPMGSMRLWRHERRIQAGAAQPGIVRLVDHLTIQPRLAPRFIGWFIKRVFEHRHEVLRAHFGQA